MVEESLAHDNLLFLHIMSSLYRPEYMQPPAGSHSASLWEILRAEAQQAYLEDRILHPLLQDVILERLDFSACIAVRLARKLSRRDMKREELEPLFLDVLQSQPCIAEAIAMDLRAYMERDAACRSYLEPLLFYKGFHAISIHRIAHELWGQGRRLLALMLQSICSEIFSVDIHPAARVGCGVMLDHGTGCVIGETAIIENDVSILHAVTLGGTGKEKGDARHPIVRTGVLLGAGAKVLGRVVVGECAKVAASSVVLQDVPSHKTVAGVPAIIVAETQCSGSPAHSMTHQLGD